MLFHAPYQALTSVLSPKELASGTGAFFLVRFTGATVGLACVLLIAIHLLSIDIIRAQSIAGAIFQSSISRNVLHDKFLTPFSTSTSLGQIPISVTVSAFRVRDNQDTAHLTTLKFLCAGRLDYVCALFRSRSACTLDCDDA
jgi:hypothetical protein